MSLMCKERTIFGTLSTKWDVFIKFLPLGPRELCRRGGRKILSKREKDDSKKSMCSRHHRTDEHMNSQTVAEEQGLHRFKSDGVLVLRGEADTGPQP